MTTQEKKKDKKEKRETLSPKNVSDILPRDGDAWKEIGRAVFGIAELHNFHYMETPVIERAEFFETKQNKESLSKNHLYIVKGKGERLALRSNYTLPFLRSYIDNHLGYFASPLKAFSYGQTFLIKYTNEHEKNISREWVFHVIGDNDPIYDVEIIHATLEVMKALKIKDVSLHININGCRTCRGAYREKIKSFVGSKKGELCSHCVHLNEKDPFAFFDCVSEKCVLTKKDAPTVLDYLCQSCNNYFKNLLELIEDNGILYELTPSLIRKSEGSNRLAFSVRSGGVELAIGGRHDYISETAFKRQIAAVGVSLFVSRITQVIQLQGNQILARQKSRVFFIVVGDQAKKASVRLMHLLRSNGIITMEALGRKSLKMQLKAAEKAKAPVSVLLGQKEVFEETAIVRDMDTGAQETVTFAGLVEGVRKKLKS